MAIRAVIFDFGDVLERLDDASGRRKWEARLGLEQDELEKAVFISDIAALASRGKAKEAEVWRALGERYGLSEAEVEELRADFWSGLKLDAELLQFLSSLRPRYKTAILSNAWDNTREVFINIHGLDKHVDLIVVSGEEGTAKPEPRIFQITLERLGVAPEEAIFVDDAPRNVEGARALGMHAILFRSAEQVMADVRALLDSEAS